MSTSAPSPPSSRIISNLVALFARALVTKATMQEASTGKGALLARTGVVMTSSNSTAIVVVVAAVVTEIKETLEAEVAIKTGEAVVVTWVAVRRPLVKMTELPQGWKSTQARRKRSTSTMTILCNSMDKARNLAVIKPSSNSSSSSSNSRCHCTSRVVALQPLMVVTGSS